MIDKTNTDGIKLYVGGEEVTKEQVERAIREYEQKIQSPEFQRELSEFADFMGTNQPTIEVQNQQTKSSFGYYRLPYPPHTIFKLDRENLTSFKFDNEKKCWIEFSTFLVDLEHGNIQADEIGFEDRYPTISAVDQSKGIKL